jgi:hypothetical protein
MRLFNSFLVGFIFVLAIGNGNAQNFILLKHNKKNKEITIAEKDKILYILKRDFITREGRIVTIADNEIFIKRPFKRTIVPIPLEDIKKIRKMHNYEYLIYTGESLFIAGATTYVFGYHPIGLAASNLPIAVVHRSLLFPFKKISTNGATHWDLQILKFDNPKKILAEDVFN